MVTVTAADLAKQFGKFRDMALTAPVSITHHGRETLVLMSTEEYHRLKALDPRKAYAAHEIPAEWREELRKPIPHYTTDLDHLMDP